jgi:cardiolipin synthase
LEEDFVKDLEESNAYVLERFKKRSIKRKLMEALGRLVSPLQ